MDNFLIKHNSSNPLWKEFITQVNTKFNIALNGDAYEYYGVINNKIYGADCPKTGANIITLEEWKEESFVLPDQWHIKGCKEVVDWFNLQTSSDYYDHTFYGFYFTYPNQLDKIGYRAGSHIGGRGTKITLEQFLKHVVKKETMQKQTISRKNLLTLYKGSTCNDWRNRIKVYLVNSATEDENFTMEINDEDVQYASENATTSQKSLIKSAGIKLIEDKSIDLTQFGAETDVEFTAGDKTLPITISIRSNGEYVGKSIYLDNKYNWELKKDGSGILCLIPTKK